MILNYLYGCLLKFYSEAHCISSGISRDGRLGLWMKLEADLLLQLLVLNSSEEKSCSTFASNSLELSGQEPLLRFSLSTGFAEF